MLNENRFLGTFRGHNTRTISFLILLLGLRFRWDRGMGKGLELTGMMCKIEQLHVQEVSQIVTLF